MIARANCASRADEIKTTFASSYAQEISLDQALELDVLQTYALQATGKKFLVNPSLWVDPQTSCLSAVQVTVTRGSKARAGLKSNIVAFAARIMIVNLRNDDQFVCLSLGHEFPHLITYRRHRADGRGGADLL